MKPLHQCRSCGHLSTAGSVFKRVTASNGRKVKVCDECADAYGHDVDVTRWVDQAAKADALASLPAASV